MIRNIARDILAVLVACFGLNANAGQYSDMWWNPQQSGWGMNVVQQLETAFVTLFVYGSDGKPTWFVAPRTTVYAYTVGGLPQFSGPLYRTQGPWHGGSFDPAAVQVTPAGSLSLEVLARNRIRVSYDADGVSVVKEVERQTWDTPILGANYHATFRLRQTLPGQIPPLGTLQYSADVLVHIDAGEGFLRIEDDLGRRCDYRGAHVQSGKLATISGTFACVPVTGAMQPTSGTFELTDLEASAHGATGFLRTYSASLNEFGRFAAALY